MISVLVIAHEPLATALIHCTRHIYGRLPSQVAALDVIPDEDPDIALRSARDLAARINDGSGLVVLTDLFGATPARVAVQLAEPLRVMVFHGANLPLLLKLLNYRRNVSLEDLARKMQESIGNSIGLVTPQMAGMDERPRAARGDHPGRDRTDMLDGAWPDGRGTDDPGMVDPGLDESGLDESGLDESGLERPGLERPRGDGSGADGSGADGSGADGSGADGSGADGPGADGPGPDGTVTNVTYPVEPGADAAEVGGSPQRRGGQGAGNS